MKKIPTLFQREFDHHRVVNISPVVVPELQWVLDGEGIATENINIDESAGFIQNRR